jgi:monoamine oxidase
MPASQISADADDPKAAAIASFATKVRSLREMAAQRYRQHLTRLLSTQQPELLTQRALLAAADQVYSEALAQLDSLMPAFTHCDSEVVQGRHALTATLLALFTGWNKALLEAALQHNASSCALSNFPSEHHPDAELLQAITLDLGAAWREFALELNTRLLMTEGAVAVVV